MKTMDLVLYRISIIRKILSEIRTYKWREHRVCKGNNFPDSTFFVLRRYHEHVGIASVVIVFLGQLRYMESKYIKAIPVVDMQNYPSDISETRFDFGNAWEDFFIQPGGYSLDDIKHAKNIIEQNRCAMACRGCGAVLFYHEIKSSRIIFRFPVLLSYHTKQSNTENPTAYE